jgi:DNA repair exonuclease SbcCD ATPase subunit
VWRKSLNIKSFKATWAGPFSEIALDIGSMKGIWTIDGNDIDAPQEDYSNGVGKTSLYDLLGFAISGKSIEDRQLSELVNDLAAQKGSDKKMTTEILIDNIRIRRGQKPKKFEVHRMDPDGSEREDLTSTASQDWLWDKWGINWDTLKFIMRFGGDENDLKSFAKADAETRRRIQDALIQADRISACLKVARKSANTIKSQCEVLIGRLNDANQLVESIASELEDLRNRQEAFNKEVEERIEELDKFVKKWSKFDFAEAYRIADDYAKLSEEINALQNQGKELEQRLRALEDKVDFLTEEIATHEKDIDRLRKKVIDEGPIERDMQRAYMRLEQARLDFDRAKENRKKRKPVELELEKAEQAVGEYKAEVKRLKDQIESAGNINAPVDTKDIEQSIKSLHQKINEKQDVIEKDRFKLKALVKRKTPSVFEAELKAVQKNHGRIKGLLDDIAKAMIATEAAEEGVACKTCGQQVTEESKAGVLARQAEEKIRYEKDLSEINAEINDIQRDLEKAKEQAAELREVEDRKERAENDLANLRGLLEVERQKLDAVRQQTLTYEKKIAEKEIAERGLKAQQNLYEGAKATVLRLKSQLAEMDDGNNKQGLLEEAEGIHERITCQLNELRIENEAVAKNIEERRSSIKSADDRRKEAKDEIADIEKQIKEIKNKISNTKAKRKVLLYEDGEEPESRDFLEKKEDRLKRSKEELVLLRKKLEDNDIKQLLQKKTNEYQKATQAAKDMEANLDKQSDLLPYYEYWVDAFKSEGIRSLAMKDLIPVLNQEMDRIMEYLEGKRARVQFDEDMSLIISNWETGDPTTYRKISGGMKKRVNIAIACAFRETIRAASGCNPSLFIVDESADSLDTPGKLGFVSLLQSMAQDSTIWVITHDKVLRPALDDVASGNIHIEMCGGVSRVFTTHY